MKNLVTDFVSEVLEMQFKVEELTKENQELRLELQKYRKDISDEYQQNLKNAGNILMKLVDNGNKPK